MASDTHERTVAMPLPLKSLGYAAGAAALATLLLLGPAAKADEDVWPTLKQQAFGDRAIQAEDGMVVLEIPGTAEDAALVPLTVRVPPQVGAEPQIADASSSTRTPIRKWRRFTSVRRPGKGGERSFSTRVRIDNFSYVRAVLETEDGMLHMASKFVAAAGGCGAMQAKDPDIETVDLGKMIVKTFPPALDASPIWSAQVMIKHPNSNGMQLDINTANVIPARYVNKMTVKRGGELVFDMDGTFSISTNPNFRFTFGRGADNSLDVAITDTDGAKFAAQSEPSGS